jgi:tRNA/rRNA methyltransferase
MSSLPPVVILDRPQLAENIGAAARVMANFGLDELRLVAPRDGWPQGRAWASASGADWPLDGARVFDTVGDAIRDLHVVYAATARPRELVLPVAAPRETALALRGASLDGLRTGLLFGAERAGLETSDIALCAAVVTVPVDPRFRSLNLAQAVALLAYEWRMSADAEIPDAFQSRATPAESADVQGLLDHLENDLEASGFFFPVENRPSMVRNLRAVFSRAGLTEQEVRTLRGVVTALSKGRGRTLARMASKRQPPKKEGAADETPNFVRDGPAVGVLAGEPGET